MANTLLVKRGTRAQLNAAAGASGLKVGEPYLITDEGRLAVGLSVSTYGEYALTGHTHPADTISFVPAGDLSATTVQTALEELDSEKQPLDSDLTALAALATTGLIERTGAGTAAIVTKPSGALVGISDTQTLTNKTLTDPVITGAILEDVYTITDGVAFELDPGNGSIQLITLGASRTPKGTNFAAGESVTLMVLDGSAYAITWTDTTFGTSGVTWVGGSAPTLDTTKYTVIELWKVASQVYGALVGAA